MTRSIFVLGKAIYRLISVDYLMKDRATVVFSPIAPSFEAALYLLLLLCQLKSPLWELGKCTFFFSNLPIWRLWLFKEAAVQYIWKLRVYQPLFFLDFNSAWYDLLFYSPYLRKILPMGQHLKLVLVFLWTPFNNCSFDRNTGSNLTAVGTYGELQNHKLIVQEQATFNDHKLSNYLR